MRRQRKNGDEPRQTEYTAWQEAPTTLLLDAQILLESLRKMLLRDALRLLQDALRLVRDALQTLLLDALQTLLRDALRMTPLDALWLLLDALRLLRDALQTLLRYALQTMPLDAELLPKEGELASSLSRQATASKSFGEMTIVGTTPPLRLFSMT